MTTHPKETVRVEAYLAPFLDSKQGGDGPPETVDPATWEKVIRTFTCELESGDRYFDGGFVTRYCPPEAGEPPREWYEQALQTSLESYAGWYNAANGADWELGLGEGYQSAYRYKAGGSNWIQATYQIEQGEAQEVWRVEESGKSFLIAMVVRISWPE